MKYALELIRVLEPEPYHIHNTTDINRLRRILKEHGIYATKVQACRLWEMHSLKFSAGWMDMQGKDNDFIFNSIREFFEVVND